jgi:DNA topoisomerase-2
MDSYINIFIYSYIGRNGYGAKLANIFSKEFVVETADKSRGLKFKQTYRNNMGTRTEPEITKFSGTDFTCITFYPDLEKFKMDFLDEDIVALLSKRVYDIAATNNASGGKLKVFLNGTEVQTRSFEAYIGICTGKHLFTSLHILHSIFLFIYSLFDCHLIIRPRNTLCFRAY